MRPHIEPLVYQTHARLKPSLSLGLTVLIYFNVIFFAWLGGVGSNWWLAPVSIVVIAALQNHLLILLHEGAHYLILPQRKWNDWWSDLFFALPMLTTTKNYRWFHMTHHQFTGDPAKDPEVALYRRQDFDYQKKPFARLLWMWFLDLIGVNLFRFLVQIQRPLLELQSKGKFILITGGEMFRGVLVCGVMLFLVFAMGLGRELLIFWFLPYVTVTFWLLKLHGYGEHNGRSGPSEYDRTWIHQFPWITNFFIYPIRSGLHLEHHQFPAIPWYNMNSFRRVLLKDPVFAQRSKHMTLDGYFFGKKTVLNEMLFERG